MNIPRYSEWSETALSLHLVCQMVGKVKLARMYPQPEWQHIVLPLTSSGFTTGLLPNGKKTFSLSVDIASATVQCRDVYGTHSEFGFADGVSVSEYHQRFNAILAEVMCETEIYTVPQEMPLTTPFEQQTEKRAFNPQQALDFFHMCVFAHNCISGATAFFRGKKLPPSFFWGTFDVTGILFSGQPAPFPCTGIIETVAFDEQMMEFGFWPGDSRVDEPSFFILPYPFIDESHSASMQRAAIQPDKAWYSPEKAEFFLTLKDAMSYPDPAQAVRDFFLSGYEVVSREMGWKNLDWFNKPLLIEQGSPALPAGGRHRLGRAWKVD